MMLVNEVYLRNLIPSGPTRSSVSFSPVAVTPDELGGAWRDVKVHLSLRTSWNGHLVARMNPVVDVTFNFAQLIVHLVRARNLRLGAPSERISCRMTTHCTGMQPVQHNAVGRSSSTGAL
jgi:fumarylacetoacetate (FAA) hydrolase